MRVTLRRINQTYFRVVTESQPLLVELGPVEVSSIDLADGGVGRVVLEVCNELAASKSYAHLVSIDRTLQQALVSDEEKANRRAVLLPIFRPPSYVPAGPRLTAQVLATTRCFQQQQQQQGEKRAQTRRQDACSIDKLSVSCRARVILDIVGLRCCGDTIWTYDVAVSSVLLTPLPTIPKTPAAAVDAVAPAMVSSCHDAADDARSINSKEQQYPFSNDANAQMDSYMPEEESEWEVPEHVPS
jgi:hypothetical protein